MTDKEFYAQTEVLLAKLPVEFRGAVSYYCWDKGHAYNYEHVLELMEGMVQMLDKPIKEYTLRVYATTKVQQASPKT